MVPAVSRRGSSWIASRQVVTRQLSRFNHKIYIWRWPIDLLFSYWFIEIFQLIVPILWFLCYLITGSNPPTPSSCKIDCILAIIYCLQCFWSVSWLSISLEWSWINSILFNFYSLKINLYILYLVLFFPELSWIFLDV